MNQSQASHQSPQFKIQKFDKKKLESQSIFNPVSQALTVKSQIKNTSKASEAKLSNNQFETTEQRKLNKIQSLVNLRELVPSKEQITGDISQIMSSSSVFLQRKVDKIDRKITGELLSLTPHYMAPDKALANKRSTSSTIYPSIHINIPKIKINLPSSGYQPQLKSIYCLSKQQTCQCGSSNAGSRSVYFNSANNNNNNNQMINQMFQKDIELRLQNMEMLPKQHRLQLGLIMSTPQSERSINPMLQELKKSPKIQNSLLFEKKKLHQIFEQQRIQNQIKFEITDSIHDKMNQKEKFLTSVESGKIESDSLNVDNIDTLKEHSRLRKVQRVYDLMNQRYSNQWMRYRVPNTSIKRTENNKVQQFMI